MSLILPKRLPAISSLLKEGIEVTTPEIPLANDLPVLRIALLNLMPNKEETEIQIMRLLAAPEFNIHMHLLNTASYNSKNTRPEYLKKFYQSHDTLVDEIDGLLKSGEALFVLTIPEDFWGHCKYASSPWRRLMAS